MKLLFTVTRCPSLSGIVLVSSWVSRVPQSICKTLYRFYRLTDFTLVLNIHYHTVLVFTSSNPLTQLKNINNAPINQCLSLSRLLLCYALAFMADANGSCLCRRESQSFLMRGKLCNQSGSMKRLPEAIYI